MVGPPPLIRVAPLFVVLFFLCVILPAEEAPLLPARVTDIEYVGAKRTRPVVLDRYVSFGVGDTIGADDLERARQELRESGLFADVLVETVPADDGVAVRFVLDEKWTLVPFPFFSASGGRYRGGLVLIESNAFGFDKQIVAVGIGGNTGFSTFLLYDDPAFLGSRWQTTLATSLGTDELERTDSGGSVLWRRDANVVAVTPRVGYRVTDALEPSVGVEFTAFDFQSKDPRAPDPGATGAVTPSVRVAFDDRRLGRVLFFGPEMTVETKFYGSDVSIDGEAEYSVPVAGLHRLRFRAAGGFGDRPLLLEQDVGGSDGYRTLPSGTLFADDYATAALFADVVVLEQNWGAVTLTPFWETVFFDTERTGRRAFYGPGGGLRVYIRQVAIPALGIDVAYNLVEESTVFSVAVGMGM